MQIYYINTDEYKPIQIDIKNKTKNNKSILKEEQHQIGRFLVDSIAKYIYKIENREIEIINKKPKFKYSNMNFNISHSNNIILVAFDKNPIGVDIEEMKDRNFEELSKRYCKNGEKFSKEIFYKFWTEYEAGIKLQGEIKTKITKIIEEKYLLTVVGDFTGKTPIYKIKEISATGIKKIQIAE